MSAAIQWIVEFLRHLTWQDWVAVVGFAFGVVGTIVASLAFIDQLRSKRGQESLIDFVRGHAESILSKGEIEKLKRQQSAMENDIANRIPALARMAVLKEQADAHARAIADHFIQWQSVTGELGAIPSTASIDPKIQRVVLDRLLPKYEYERTRDELRASITLLSVVIALTGTLFYFLFPIAFLIQLILAIPLVLALFRYFAFYSDAQLYSYVEKALLIGYWALVLLLAVVVGALALNYNIIDSFGRGIMVALIAIDLLLASANV
jgi:hypothetical protein